MKQLLCGLVVLDFFSGAGGQPRADGVNRTDLGRGVMQRVSLDDSGKGTGSFRAVRTCRAFAGNSTCCSQG